MDESEVKRVIAANLDRLARLMGVSHWDIKVFTCPCDNPRHMADCEANVDYDMATITVDPAKAGDAAGVVRSLIHEMAHIALAPFNLYRELATQHVRSGTPEEMRDNRAYTYACEQAVINLERMYRGLTDGRRGPDYMPVSEATTPAATTPKPAKERPLKKAPMSKKSAAPAKGGFPVKGPSDPKMTKGAKKAKKK